MMSERLKSPLTRTTGISTRGGLFAPSHGSGSLGLDRLQTARYLANRNLCCRQPWPVTAAAAHAISHPDDECSTLPVQSAVALEISCSPSQWTMPPHYGSSTPSSLKSHHPLSIQSVRDMLKNLGSRHYASLQTSILHGSDIDQINSRYTLGGSLSRLLVHFKRHESAFFDLAILG